MSSEKWDNPRNWRFRAEETRLLADVMKNLEARVIMLRIAADYDWLADMAK